MNSMMSQLWRKIEYVRSQPENVRMRYVAICLALSMVFIVGIWILTLRESMANARQEGLGGGDLLRETSVPSLTELIEKSSPLQVENQPMTTGEEYFQSQLNPNAHGSAEQVGGESTAPEQNQ